MNQRHISIPLILASAGLLIVCGLCALTVYGTYAWFNTNRENVHLFYSADTSAQVTEEQTFDAKPKLIIASDSGSITLIADDSPDIQVEMTKTGWGADQTEAETTANSLRVNVEETSAALKLTYRAPEEFGVVMNRSGNNRVDFTIHIPRETAVEINSGFGDISLDGLAQSIQITNSLGDILAKNLQAGKNSVHLETSFGDTTVDNTEGEDLYIGTSNGMIMATNLTATGDLEIENQFGDIHLEGFGASKLTISSQNGDIEVLDGTLSKEINVTNAFGEIQVKNTEAASYRMESQNGKVFVDGANGSVKITNSFGDIEITNGKQVTLDVTSQNGVISYSGSLNPEADHQLENNFGDITLTLPEDSAFDLNLETSFGDINSEFPVTLTGALNESSWQAEMNGGGHLITANTSNGNISLQILTSGEE
ncbi:MAG: DUF4097 family beta strand repeat protein [Anaerolineales bacterium]|nr:DUF4097 family beta strand repeat protein [Anaerolineales bacterium]